MARKKSVKVDENRPAFLFDLDGTLVDSVYQHVLAWGEALHERGIDLSIWRVHRRVGMSDGVILSALQREIGRKLDKRELEKLKQLHSEAFLQNIQEVRPMPGARELLAELSELQIPWAIATSGTADGTKRVMKILDLETDPPLVTSEDVAHGKPFPDLFVAAAKLLKVALNDCIVVGDSVWDLLASRRAHALGVGLLCGGYGMDELEQAGAYRVYEDPAELMRHVDELGVEAEP
jgi:HAD superfamily hydrolase (TIGR01509 family)